MKLAIWITIAVAAALVIGYFVAQSMKNKGQKRGLDTGQAPLGKPATKELAMVEDIESKPREANPALGIK